MQLLKNKHIIKHLCQQSSMKIWIFSALQDSNTNLHGRSSTVMCTCVCEAAGPGLYASGRAHGEGGVSDMLIGLHNIITLQAFVDRIAVPDKNYAIWSSSLSLLLSLPEYKPTLKELTLPQVLFCSRRSLFCCLMAKGVHTRGVAVWIRLSRRQPICYNALCKFPLSVAKTRQY